MRLRECKITYKMLSWGPQTFQLGHDHARARSLGLVHLQGLTGHQNLKPLKKQDTAPLVIVLRLEIREERFKVFNQGHWFIVQWCGGSQTWRACLFIGSTTEVVFARGHKSNHFWSLRILRLILVDFKGELMLKRLRIIGVISEGVESSELGCIWRWRLDLCQKYCFTTQ